MTGITETETTTTPAANSFAIGKTGVPVPESLRRPILTRPKVLMGTGPTNFTQRVSEALSKPLMGLYAKETFQIMEEIKDGLQYLFQTKNALTYCTTGSGNSGMETVLSNLIDDGDVVLVAVIGAFGHRAVDMSTRYGADVRVLESKLGTSLTYEQIQAHVETHKPKILFVVHGDSSTGVLQKIDKLGELCRRHGCLLLIDAVSTLGALELKVDEWKIDAAFAGSQKALGAPAGFAPVTFSPRAIEVIRARRTPTRVYFYDALLVGRSWNCFAEEAVPHHSISAVGLYGLREALAEIIDEGVESFRERHVDNAQRLYEGLMNIGLEPFVEKAQERLPTITSVRIPHGLNFTKIQNYLMERYSLEISKGFGCTEGLIFRIGLLNSNATHQKVDFVLRALYDALRTTVNYIAPRSKVYY